MPRRSLYRLTTCALDAERHITPIRPIHTVCNIHCRRWLMTMACKYHTSIARSHVDNKNVEKRSGFVSLSRFHLRETRKRRSDHCTSSTSHSSHFSFTSTNVPGPRDFKLCHLGSGVKPNAYVGKQYMCFTLSHPLTARVGWMGRSWANHGLTS